MFARQPGRANWTPTPRAALALRVQGLPEPQADEATRVFVDALRDAYKTPGRVPPGWLK